MGEGSVMSWLANLSSLNLTRQGLQPLSGLGAALNIACFLVVLCGVCRRCLQSCCWVARRLQQYCVTGT